MQSKSPRISIVMPVWNRAHLVLYSIQSIFDQSFTDWEFIAVDDGSDDNTWQILQECRKREPKLKPYRMEKHEGIYHALIKANELAKGEIIIKHDSDDLSLPNRLEVIDRYFKKNPQIDFLYHSIYQTFEGEGEMLRRVFIPALPVNRKRILKEQYIPGAFAYTKKFITDVPYRKTWCSDDWMLILDAVFKNKKIGYIDEALYEYTLRIDSNSQIHEHTGHYEEDEKNIMRWLQEDYGIKNFKYAKRS